MRIFLVRHGHYDLDTGLLSPGGQYDVSGSTLALRLACAHLGHYELFSSPVKRAQQTAELIKEAFGFNGFETVAWLIDGFEVKEAADKLKYLAEDSVTRNIIAVSHMAKISALVNEFAASFHQPPFGNPDYGSVHLVNLQERKVSKLT